MRKATGAEVEGDAEHAVQAASQTSGQQLPGDLRSRFESSLGTDLSSVRVHTGEASEHAAKSVAARAYTVGNDIHFGADQYNPSSGSGQHLIAHEVAHTVQQRGGTPTRQNKLEASTAGDIAEVEADVAADAMVNGGSAQVSGASDALRRKGESEVQLPTDYMTPSSEMRAEGKAAATAQKQAVPIDGGSVTADVGQADTYINRIQQAQGGIGELQGREDAINAEPRWVKENFNYVKHNQGAQALAANKLSLDRLTAFKKSAQRQDFQHAFFAPAFQTLEGEFAQLKANVEVIKSQQLKVVGDDAKSDVQAAIKANPQLGVAIASLKTAVGNLKDTATHAESGMAACASKAGSSFDHLSTATDEMKLPLPTLEQTKEQADAAKIVANVNADLESAKTMISTVKTVVETSVSALTGGTGAAFIPELDKVFKKMGEKATDIIDKTGSKGIVDPGKKAAAAVQTDLEGKLAAWVTNYNSRIASANGRAGALTCGLKEKQSAIAADKVANWQTQVAQEIGRFFSLALQIEEKKKAVYDAAKAVSLASPKKGKKGSNIGAAAQAMASVSVFLTQAEAAEQLGEQEKVQGDAASKSRKDAAGDYFKNKTPGAFGGPGGVAETESLAADTKYFEVKKAGDADSRGDHDLSGYEVLDYRIKFTVNEDDVSKRSQPMADKTDAKLKLIAGWKVEAKAFQDKLTDALGMGEPNIE